MFEKVKFYNEYHRSKLEKHVRFRPKPPSPACFMLLFNIPPWNNCIFSINESNLKEVNSHRITHYKCRSVEMKSKSVYDRWISASGFCVWIIMLSTAAIHPEAQTVCSTSRITACLDTYLPVLDREYDTSILHAFKKSELEAHCRSFIQCAIL